MVIVTIKNRGVLTPAPFSNRYHHLVWLLYSCSLANGWSELRSAKRKEYEHPCIKVERVVQSSCMIAVWKLPSLSNRLYRYGQFGNV